MDRLLDGLTQFINAVRTDPESPQVRQYGRRAAEEYFRVRRETPDFMRRLDAIFADDAELYLLVLSALFFLFRERQFLDRAEALAWEPSLSYDQALGVWKQAGMIRFHNGWESSGYEAGREMQAYFAERLRRELGYSGQRRFFGKKGGKRILMATDVLLSDLHAPTQIVLEMCRELQEHMGYEVLLLVCVEYTPREVMDNLWLYPYHAHFNARYHHFFEREYRGVRIRGYQQVISQAHFQELPGMFDVIEDWGGMFAWYIGGTSVIAELLGDVTPLACMPCSDGYAISSAPVLVSYMQNDRERVREMESCIKRRHQKEVKIDICLDYSDTGRAMTAGDFGFPPDAFVIAVVGNRLDSELNSGFLEVMEQILQESDRAGFIIVGNCGRDWNLAPFSGRVKNLGFREDLYNVLQGADLFLNPVRKGGGGGAACALKAGVPVVTLGGCDVANVGEEFVCDSLADYPALVGRYECDQAFYRERSDLSRQRFAELMAGGSFSGCTKVIEAMDILCGGG